MHRMITKLGKTAGKARKNFRRIKRLEPLYRNRRKLARVLKSVGQVLEKRA